MPSTTASNTPVGRPFAPRIALNPIQWMATDDGWLDPSKAPAWRELLAHVKKAGFEGVMAEVPAHSSVEEYRDGVDEIGIALAPGYFVCRSDGMDGTQGEVLDAARRVAQQHAQLGLRDVGLGMGMSKDASRLQHPGQGYAADDARLTALTELIGNIVDVMAVEGVRPALHPHIATWIETEAESRAALDAFQPAQLGFLPDTGHLAWAGADVRGLIADYAERIPFVHVKDCRLSVARRGRDAGWGYQQTVLAGMWVEPGRGELPLTEILGALPPTFDGWLMVEVDRPDISDPFDSAQVSANWMYSTYGRAVSRR
jgi:inosose dehydratase